jgi:hypothetical protein
VRRAAFPVVLDAAVAADFGDRDLDHGVDPCGAQLGVVGARCRFVRPRCADGCEPYLGIGLHNRHEPRGKRVLHVQRGNRLVDGGLDLHGRVGRYDALRRVYCFPHGYDPGIQNAAQNYDRERNGCGGRSESCRSRPAAACHQSCLRAGGALLVAPADDEIRLRRVLRVSDRHDSEAVALLAKELAAPRWWRKRFVGRAQRLSGTSMHADIRMH